MKKLLFAAIAILFALTTAVAQEGEMSSKSKKTPEERAETFTKKMTKHLNLDQAQQERARAINLERFKKIEEARAMPVKEKGEMASRLKTINEDYFNNMKGVLSADQYTKLQEMKEEMKERAFKKKQNQ